MLLDETIEILSDERGSLNNALLKTKVLLHSLGKNDLATWVSNELIGYPDENIPSYRMVGASVHGHLVNFTWQVDDYPLPIMHLTKKQREDLTRFPCMLSISSIEQTINKNKAGVGAGKLIRELPPEFGSLLAKALSSGTNVTRAWCEINMMDVERILSEVRSRLLDFTLELRDVVGVDVPEKELRQKAGTADTAKMFTTAIYGAGNTIIIGSHSFQAITNQKDDIEGLIREIGKLGYQENELAVLRRAILEDQAKGQVPDITTGKTSEWFAKALKGAGRGAVKVGVDIASAVIVKAIEAYTKGGN